LPPELPTLQYFLGQPGFPFEIFQDKEINTSVLAEIVDRANVRMIEAGIASAYRSKRWRSSRSAASREGNTSTPTVAVQARVAGFVALLHPPRPNAPEFIRTEF